MGTLTDDAIVAIRGGKSDWKFFSFCFVKSEMGIASHFRVENRIFERKGIKMAALW